MQKSYLVHPQRRQSHMVPERLHAALRDAGRGRVMAQRILGEEFRRPEGFASVDVGQPGGLTDSYDPAADRPGTMTFVDMNIVQCGLNSHGAHLAVDGRYGPQTGAALAAFVSIMLTPASSEGAATLPPYPAQFSFVAPSAGGTSVKMSAPLKDALLAHTDVGACIQAAVGGGSGHASVTEPAPGALITAAPGGVPAWLYWTIGIGAALGLGAWAFSGSKKRKGR